MDEFNCIGVVSCPPANRGVTGVGSVGPQGPQGIPGPAGGGGVSADAGNFLKMGSDGKLFLDVAALGLVEIKDAFGVVINHAFP